MRSIKSSHVVAGAFLIFTSALVLATAPVTRAQEPEGNFGVGVPEVFVPRYLAFRSAQLSSSTPHVMRVKLGYVKGLSRSFTNMVGEAAIDLESGAITINLSGLTPLQTYTVSLVDSADNLLPLPDIVTGLVTFLATGPTALLNGLLPALSLLPTIDRVVVSEGLLFGQPLAAGTVNVFQKAFFRRVSLVNESTGELLFDETTAPPALFDRIPPLEFETEDGSLPIVPGAPGVEIASSSGSSRRSVKMDRLISRGAELFFEETFEGNGRTCGTCHPASNNFMIDKDFIATLPANDPLFVAEFNPALKDLERPKLMRSFGLILENLDGFSPPSRFVMRGVPHTIGMPVSLTADPTQTPTPAEMTGWSGDGSPGTGSLREFAIGAVRQHFTKRLNRVENVDFELPRDRQLDAMEAFQLSIGRAADFNLANITFRDAAVQNGKILFVNGTGSQTAGGRCSACHNNAGALTPAGPNGNFNTNVEKVAHPARSIQTFPKDGGFGQTNNGDGTFGNRAFNTPPVVEAADTPPFFHNNVVATLEGVVDFYSGPEFNNGTPPQFQFSFNQTQRNQIADFMRAINTLQNIDLARLELRQILNNPNDHRREQDARLQKAFEDVDDGIGVLNEGGIYSAAAARLTEARNLISLAQSDPGGRRTHVSQAIAKLDQARAIIA
jgi:cytochrome c peroxidase